MSFFLRLHAEGGHALDKITFSSNGIVHFLLFVFLGEGGENDRMIKRTGRHTLHTNSGASATLEGKACREGYLDRC